MPDPIVSLTLEQFNQLLATANLRRAINAVHLHHTWRPRRRDFRGVATVEAMRRFHQEQLGWQDIAQHLSIDPAGGLWTGRNWNLPPASQKGHNGTSKAGPFMIEMIGDFDRRQDPFDGPQRAVVVAVVARLLHRFELPAEALRFHRQLGSPKTCPGTSIDYDAFSAEVEAVRTTLAGARARGPEPRSPFGDIELGHLRGFTLTDNPRTLLDPPDAEVPELVEAGRWIDAAAAEAAGANQREWRRSRSLALRPRATDRWSGIKPYVINLALGQLSEEGEFRTTPSDLEGIFESIAEYTHEVERPRLVLHAHGGLVSETSALDYAAKVVPWWRAKGIYPVYFVWESGLLEILGQYVLGRRDLADWTSDPALEVLLGVPGSLAWSGMKKSARLASSPDTGSGYPGGGFLFAELLAARRNSEEFAKLEVHAVGHSAGSIFHAHLLPELVARGIAIETLHLLAPAITATLFRARLLPLLNAGGIRRLHEFTMEDRAERADDCLKVYRKSLLYLVSRSFESSGNRALLGLRRSLRSEDDLAKLFGLDGGATPRAELQLSRPDDDQEANPLTAALRHGDFDNDPATMSSVLRRIVGADDSTQLGRHDFPMAISPRSLADLLPPAPAPAIAAAASGDGAAQSAPLTGTRKALCVGINRYREKPLSGCVKDAKAWGEVLGSLGFDVRYLLDQEATRIAILDGIRRMLAGAGSGDVLAFQYSGHGSQMPDEDGDEGDQYDETLVPFDYYDGHFLLDDDLAQVLVDVPPGAQLTLFMDCCHSGTNSRFAPFFGAQTTTVDRVRWMDPTADLVRAHQAFRAGRPAAPRGIKEESAARVIHLAACQDQEYAWESAGQGDFTGAATRLLAAAVARGDTNEVFLASVRDEVTRRGRQHPMMMPPPADMAGRPLLGAIRAAAAV